MFAAFSSGVVKKNHVEIVAGGNELTKLMADAGWEEAEWRQEATGEDDQEYTK